MVGGASHFDDDPQELDTRMTLEDMAIVLCYTLYITETRGEIMRRSLTFGYEWHQVKLRYPGALSGARTVPT